MVHHWDVFELGFKQLEILPEKRLKIFVLAQAEKGMVRGYGFWWHFLILFFEWAGSGLNIGGCKPYQQIVRPESNSL